MEDSDGLEIMRIVLGTLARVHALEHMTFVLTATHPYPDVALEAWDASLPSWTDRAFQYSSLPEFAEVFRQRTAKLRESLAVAADQATKR